ncbi:MAG: cell division protein FtsZ [Rhodospirillales bacterium]|nr:cell division protein FtsZ [Rhodospirillales bacterium]
MTLNLTVPQANDVVQMKPKITVIGVGGAGCNAVNNMIEADLKGVDFVVANTDAQALASSRTERRIQLGVNVTRGLGAGSRPDVGQAAADESLEQILAQLQDSNMLFIAAGMGGGTGTGAAPVIARAAREQGILTVGVVTKPFQFEGVHRMRVAEAGISELEQYVDTLIIIPNQNLFRVANEKTTFADAFKMADDVLYSGVRGITDLMVMPGLINLDFADVRAVMSEMGKAMMGTGEASGERRALDAAEAAIANPLLDDVSMSGATGVLINITGGPDLTLFEVDEAANRIRAEVDQEAQIIFGSSFEADLEGRIRVSIVSTGMKLGQQRATPPVTDSIVRPEWKRKSLPTMEASPEPLPKIVPIRAAEGDQPIAEAIAAADKAIAASPAASVPAELVRPAPAPMPAPAPLVAEPLPQPVAPAAVVAPKAAPAPKEAFIAPPPVEVGGGMGMTADPFNEAAITNAQPQPQVDLVAFGKRPTIRVSGPSLFTRVTGIGRATPQAQQLQASAPAPTRAPERRPVVAESAPAVEIQRPKAEPRLGAIEPAERVVSTRNEDDLLDIPAFLRRQAN